MTNLLRMDALASVRIYNFCSYAQKSKSQRYHRMFFFQLTHDLEPHSDELGRVGIGLAFIDARIPALDAQDFEGPVLKERKARKP